MARIVLGLGAAVKKAVNGEWSLLSYDGHMRPFVNTLFSFLFFSFFFETEYTKSAKRNSDLPAPVFKAPMASPFDDGQLFSFLPFSFIFFQKIKENKIKKIRSLSGWVWTKHPCRRSVSSIPWLPFPFFFSSSWMSACFFLHSKRRSLFVQANMQHEPPKLSMPILPIPVAAEYEPSGVSVQDTHFVLNLPKTAKHFKDGQQVDAIGSEVKSWEKFRICNFEDLIGCFFFFFFVMLFRGTFRHFPREATAKMNPPQRNFYSRKSMSHFPSSVKALVGKSKRGAHWRKWSSRMKSSPLSLRSFQMKTFPPTVTFRNHFPLSLRSLRASVKRNPPNFQPTTDPGTLHSQTIP